MRLLSMIAIIAMILVISCSVQKSNQSATSTSEYGYIRLSGSMLNREARIDGNIVGVDPEDDSNTLRLKSGLHKLEIRSSNRILLTEDFLVTEGQTVEVTVP